MTQGRMTPEQRMTAYCAAYAQWLVLQDAACEAQEEPPATAWETTNETFMPDPRPSHAGRDLDRDGCST